MSVRNIIVLQLSFIDINTVLGKHPQCAGEEASMTSLFKGILGLKLRINLSSKRSDPIKSLKVGQLSPLA